MSPSCSGAGAGALLELRPSLSGARAGASPARSSLRLTETRIPASSIVTSATPGLLDDAHEIADPLGLSRIDASGRQRVLAGRAAADRAQERLGVLAEQREQEQLLLARGEALGFVAQLGEVRHRLLLRQVAGNELDRAQNAFVDRRRRSAVPAGDQRAELVHDHLVARRRQDVDESLGGEDLSDRRGQRRPAGLRPDPGELVEHLVDPVAGCLGAELRVERSDQAGRDVVLRRRERRCGARGA